MQYILRMFFIGENMKHFDLSEISGGVAALLLHPAVYYPTVGCGSYMGIQYMKDPNSSGRDYARMCAYGALHGANPGFGIVSSAVANPLLRYPASIGYSALAIDFVNRVIPPESHVCPFDANNLYSGDE